jgi:hypothetical protein
VDNSGRLGLGLIDFSFKKARCFLIYHRLACARQRKGGA